jgi:hypothetical protein
MALVDDATAHPWVNLQIEQPQHCVELSGQEGSLLVSGEFVMFREQVLSTMHLGA